MANFIAEVAAMLGVKVGQKFKINELETMEFMFDDNSFIAKTINPPGYINEQVNHNILAALITGDYTVKPGPWKPSEDEMFFVIAHDGDVMTKYWDDCSTMYRTYYKIGNCYKTMADAKASRDKWISFYSSDEILEV